MPDAWSNWALTRWCIVEARSAFHICLDRISCTNDLDIPNCAATTLPEMCGFLMYSSSYRQVCLVRPARAGADHGGRCAVRRDARRAARHHAAGDLMPRSVDGPVLRALSVVTLFKNRDQGCALDPRRKEVKIKDLTFWPTGNR
jgi:hypothetical protein